MSAQSENGKVSQFDWTQRIECGDKGPKKNIGNLMLCLRNLPGLGAEFRYNELSGSVEWRGKVIQDPDYIDIRLIVEAAHFPCDKNDIPNAVERASLDHSYHPIKDYLEPLTWDGYKRLPVWLSIALGAPQTDYESVIGTKFLIGAVARVYQPGCKMDNMLVLEGPQDLGKSSALAALFGREYFTEAMADLRDHPRFVGQMRGKWILEFAELAAIRRSDIEMVKAVITTQVDRVRLAYRRNETEHPRRCVLAATVNPQEEAGYLTDPTGNRRFWPISCTKIDLSMLTSRRDQIWAEALHRYRAGEHWWLENGEREKAASEQVQRLSIDPWQDHLRHLVWPDKTYTSIELLGLLELAKDRQNQGDKIRIAKAMKALGWRQRRTGERYWEKSPADPVPSPLSATDSLFPKDCRKS